LTLLLWVRLNPDWLKPLISKGVKKKYYKMNKNS